MDAAQISQNVCKCLFVVWSRRLFEDILSKWPSDRWSNVKMAEWRDPGCFHGKKVGERDNALSQIVRDRSILEMVMDIFLSISCANCLT